MVCMRTSCARVSACQEPGRLLPVLSGCMFFSYTAAARAPAWLNVRPCRKEIGIAHPEAVLVGLTSVLVGSMSSCLSYSGKDPRSLVMVSL